MYSWAVCDADFPLIRMSLGRVLSSRMTFKHRRSFSDSAATSIYFFTGACRASAGEVEHPEEKNERV